MARHFYFGFVSEIVLNLCSGVLQNRSHLNFDVDISPSCVLSKSPSRVVQSHDVVKRHVPNRSGLIPCQPIDRRAGTYYLSHGRSGKYPLNQCLILLAPSAQDALDRYRPFNFLKAASNSSCADTDFSWYFRERLMALSCLHD